MKPILNTESTANIKNVLFDPANLLSVNSLDGRINLVGKASGSETFVVLPNPDGSTVGITFPSDYNGMFILPTIGKLAGATSIATSSGFGGFFFIKDATVSSSDPLFGVTFISSNNGGKQYYTNSAGLLAKVSDTTTLRKQYGKNNLNWEPKGILFEPSTYNILTAAWNGLTYGAFAATGATAGITSSIGYGSSYWDSSAIPSGMTVWSLTEITTGPNKENTVIIPASAVNFMRRSDNSLVRPVNSSISNSFFPVGGQLSGFTAVGYTADTSIIGPPQSGYISWNTTTQTNATTLFIHRDDNKGTNRSAMLNSLKPDDTIVLAGTNNTVWQKFIVNTGTVQGGNTYYGFPVQYFANGGTTFLNNVALSVGPNVPFTNFNIQAFFKPGPTVGGITKDIVQIWAVTDTSGSVKKSVFFNLTDCAPVSVSSGGTTFAWYNTEPYENGWCRCTMGVGLTGTTYAAWDGIPQFGFSTARPDGSGGYTFGGLLGTSAGNLYFSGIKVDWNNTINIQTKYFIHKLAPSSYLDPNGFNPYAADNIKWDIPYSNNKTYFYDSDFNTVGKNTLFMEKIINGPLGICGDDVGFGTGLFNNYLVNNSNQTSAVNGCVLFFGMATSNVVPVPANYEYASIRYYEIAASKTNQTGQFFPTNPVRRGYTYSEFFKSCYVFSTGDYRAYWNGLTMNGATWGGAVDFSAFSPVKGNIYMESAARDKVVCFKNLAVWGRTLSEQQGINLTSFQAQGAPVFSFLGSDGGYDGTTFKVLNSKNQNVSINNTANPLSTGKYPKETVAL